MSDPAPGRGRGPIACPRCEAEVAPDQDWCLACGAPARTRLAPLPNWKLPLGLLAGVLVAAVVALAIAFVALTDDDGPVDRVEVGATGPTGPTVVPAAPPPAAVTPPATPPVATTGASGPTG